MQEIFFQELQCDEDKASFEEQYRRNGFNNWKFLLLLRMKIFVVFWRLPLPSILCEVQAQIEATLHVRHLLFPFPVDFKIQHSWHVVTALSRTSLTCDFNEKISYLDKSHKSVHQWHNRLSWNTTYLGTQKPWIPASLLACELFESIEACWWIQDMGLTVLSIKAGSARSRTEVRIRWSLLCKP